MFDKHFNVCYYISIENLKGATTMKLTDIIRNDYWNTELHKAMTIYTVATLAELNRLTKELRRMGYNIVTFGNTRRELERPEHFVIIERR